MSQQLDGLVADEPNGRGWSAALGGLRHLGAADQVVLAAVALSTVARASFATYPTTLRIAVFLLVGLPGLVLLVSNVRRGRTERWLVAFLLAALVSVMLSGNVLLAFHSDITGSPSWLFLALGAGWWTVGVGLSPEARRFLPWVLLGGFAVNAVIGLIQVVADIRMGALATFSGRASGLMDNPVYFGTFGAGLTAWALVVNSRADGRAWLVLVGALSFATGLSGSRIATISVFTVALVAVVATRSARTVLAALVAVGSAFAASAFTSAFARNSTVERISTGEGPGQRFEIWRYGVSAAAERPLFGWGPGHFGAATWPRYTFEFVRDSAWSDSMQPWTYPHNLAVMLLTTTGLVGVACFVGFLLSGWRRVDDIGLVAFAAGAAMTYSLQPSTVQTWPIVLLVLGAAMRPAGDEPATWSAWTRPVWIACAIGAAGAVYLVVADYRLGAASERGDLDGLESAAAWLPNDPAVAGFVANQMELAGTAGQDRFDDALVWSVRARDWAPESPMAHTEVAIRQFLVGDLDGMKASLDRAVEIQEWSPSARRLLVVHALAVDDPVAAAEAVEDACSLRLQICDEARRELEAMAP